MIYELKPKADVLKYLLGNIDWLDVSYVIQLENKRAYNNLLICLTPSMLDILYKYDAASPHYVTDWTETGGTECLKYQLEYISDNLVKINITQKFVRCFSYYKEKPVTGSTTTTNSKLDYISLYPSLFLDSESEELVTILNESERNTLLASKAMNIEFNTKGGYWLPTASTVATRAFKYPSYIEFFTFVDSHVNYPRKDYKLKDSVTGADYTVGIQNDTNPAEDKYSVFSKVFNIINDSTIIMDFEFYINLNTNKYLLDINDININYHVNVLGDKTIGLTNFNLSLYETVSNYFKVNDIVYLKNIYTDTIEFVGKVMNIVAGNKLALSRIWSSNGAAWDVTAMDKYVLNRVKNLENFNVVQQNTIIQKLIANNMFSIDDMTFTLEDYLTLNNLG